MQITKKQVDEVCKLGQGPNTCSFLMVGMDGFECAKQTSFESLIRSRRNAGAMNAKGDNCSGPPDFKSINGNASDESPILVLPKDETRKQQLRKKLAEYRGRIDPSHAPETQMSAICKTTVLERLLRDGQVKTYDLSLEMAEMYGSGFDVNKFNNACGVIDDYCKTGGQNVSGGTGLPT
ncbi:MAG: hypothetical protein AAB556_00990 [Patescibacteria group bacterium]